MKEAEFSIETILANVKSERACKQCGVNVGKGLQLCAECRALRLKARGQRNLKGIERLPRIVNFKREEHGNPIEKICTKCNLWLPITSFSKRSDTACGCRYFCKPCERERLRVIQAAKPKAIPILRLFKCAVCGDGFQALRMSKYCSNECADDRAREHLRNKSNSIHVAMEAKCRRCGETKPLEAFTTKKQDKPFKCLPTACADCKAEARKRKARKSRNNPKNKPRQRLSKRFHETMILVRKGGSHHLRDFIGCSTATLRKHLESQFARGIRWDNYGTKWHVDHILPVSSFDHSDINQVRKCWHYSNLRPLCAMANGIKSNSIITCQPELLLQVP